MLSLTYPSAGASFKITVFPPVPADSKRHPMILLLHGNLGLGEPYGKQIKAFAETLAGLGYLTAVPQNYQGDEERNREEVLLDLKPEPHVQTLSDAIEMVAGLLEADPSRIGLIGYSLGAGAAMSYIGSNPSRKVKILADFFGPLPNNINTGAARFPPTIIFHNKLDRLVVFSNTQRLFPLLPDAVEHKVTAYVENLDALGFNHAFDPHGAAYKDSQTQTEDWFAKHLPPTAS